MKKLGQIQVCLECPSPSGSILSFLYIILILANVANLSSSLKTQLTKLLVCEASCNNPGGIRSFIALSTLLLQQPQTSVIALLTHSTPVTKPYVSQRTYLPFFIFPVLAQDLAQSRYPIAQETLLNASQRISLVAQLVRIHLPMQGTRVRALVLEDPTCRGATKPVRHSY